MNLIALISPESLLSLHNAVKTVKVLPVSIAQAKHDANVSNAFQAFLKRQANDKVLADNARLHDVIKRATKRVSSQSVTTIFRFKGELLATRHDWQGKAARYYWQSIRGLLKTGGLNLSVATLKACNRESTRHGHGWIRIIHLDVNAIENKALLREANKRQQLTNKLESGKAFLRQHDYVESAVKVPNKMRSLPNVGNAKPSAVKVSKSQGLTPSMVKIQGMSYDATMHAGQRAANDITFSK